MARCSSKIIHMDHSRITAQILSESPPRLITRLAIPSIVSLVATQLYQLTDAFFISSLGTSQAAAVAINNSLEQIIAMMGSFLCVGASSFIARRIGSGQREEADQALSFSFIVAFLFGIILLVLGLLFLYPLVYFLGANDEILVHCANYARYVLLAAPFMVANFVTNKVLCAEGRSTYAMIGMISGAILNVILDPIMIFSMEMGVTGASIATAISKFFSFIILLLPFIFRRSSLELTFFKAWPKANIVLEISIIGFPSLLRVLVQNSAAIIINNMASGYSTAVLAGIASSNRIMALVSTIIIGMSQGYQPVIGQNWGAGNYQRVLNSFQFMFYYSVGVMFVLGVPVYCLAKPILLVFNRQLNQEMLAIGLLFVRSQCLVLAIEAWTSFVAATYTSTGKAIGSAILSLSRQGFCYIPVLLILPKIIGADGLALSQAVANVIALCVTIPFAKKWIREVQLLIESDSVNAK